MSASFLWQQCIRLLQETGHRNGRWSTPNHGMGASFRRHHVRGRDCHPCPVSKVLPMSCRRTSKLSNKRLLQSRKEVSGSEALALRLALRIGMLAAQQNRETLGSSLQQEAMRAILRNSASRRARTF
jgi:hypothetical protein